MELHQCDGTHCVEECDPVCLSSYGESLNLAIKGCQSMFDTRAGKTKVLMYNWETVMNRTLGEALPD